MHYEIWATLAGALLIFMALTRSFIDRAPLSGALVYALVGLATSPLWLGLSHIDIPSRAEWFERGTEAVVLVSLFTAGLKLSAGVGDRRWRLPLRLATVSMVITVAGVALVAWAVLGFSVGEAVLLGGILAPTDPVLAADVQVNDAGDKDALRFALTGEGGLNDGTAFPVVMLGLGLLGLNELGASGWRWFAVDVIWSPLVGIAIGALLGMAIGRLVLHLREAYKEAVGLDDFLSLGLVATAYGLAMLCHASGFLAVFAAGFALRQTERRATQAASDAEAQRADEEGSSEDMDKRPRFTDAGALPARAYAVATNRRSAPAFMAHAVLTFNEQLERIGEAASVTALGAVLWAVDWSLAVWWFVPLLFLVIRPISVALGALGTESLHGQRRLIAWFGIRGVGSVFYLAYAQTHGLPVDVEPRMTAIVLSVVVASLLLHGVSVTPLMRRYEGWLDGRRQRGEA